MAKPPRRGGEMRGFYPVFQVTELAADYRYTTGFSAVVFIVEGPHVSKGDETQRIKLL
jgi:hypothetical protein